MPCIICGKEPSTKIKLPHGSFDLCDSQDCLQHLNFKVNNNNVPVIWFSITDLIDKQLIDKKMTKPLNKIHIVTQLADNISECLWERDFGQMWHDALEGNVDVVEEYYVNSVKENDLPLIDINCLTTDTAKNILEERLKGSKNDDAPKKNQKEGRRKKS
jgi:hypothetical protein